MASAVADSLRGTAKVAVQPYQAYEDVAKMYPDLRRPSPYDLPLWVLVADGEKLGHLTHTNRSGDIVAFVANKLKAKKKTAPEKPEQSR